MNCSVENLIAIVSVQLRLTSHLDLHGRRGFTSSGQNVIE